MWSSTEGHELVEWEIEHARRPPHDGYDAVLVFGGDQNVGEEVEHPWLHDEYDALRALGRRRHAAASAVCLGAQTLAHALGGSSGSRSSRRPARRVLRDELTAHGVADPVLGVLPPAFEALNANALRVHVPPGAVDAGDGAGRAGVPCGRPRLGGAVPPGGAARPGARLVRRGRARPAAAARRARAGARRGLLEPGRSSAPALPCVSLAAGRRRRLRLISSSGSSSWRDHSCHEPDVVARVVAERPEELRRDRRARAAVAVGDDLGARLETELGLDRRRARAASAGRHRGGCAPGMWPCRGSHGLPSVPSYSPCVRTSTSATSPSRAASSSSSMSLTATARPRPRRRPTAAARARRASRRARTRQLDAEHVAGADHPRHVRDVGVEALADLERRASFAASSFASPRRNA